MRLDPVASASAAHGPESGTSYENVAGQGVTARGSLRKPRPDRIPAPARLTAHRKSACWALRRLDGPTTNLRYQSRGLRSKRTDTTDDQSRQCQLPQRLHTPPPTSPQVSRLESPASTVAWTRTSRRIPGGPGAARSGLRVCAGHRSATQSSEDCQNGTVSIPPLGIRKGPPNCVSAAQRPSRARGGR